ncbi:MAG: polyketide synthase dehydratase domain-containing protein, partial [Syntrophales bacterium]|nr:polyketide synthase dehydratase domain-containing protein [Syntrophales bacterium]
GGHRSQDGSFMESLSPSVRDMKIPLSMAIPAYLRDHRYEGRVVLPAAEALQILAKSLPEDLPRCNPLLQVEGEFARLLHLDPEADTLNVFHEIAITPDGCRQSRLTTLHSGRQTQVNRRMTHVSVLFSSIEHVEAGRKDGLIDHSGEGSPDRFSRKRGEDPVCWADPAHAEAAGLSDPIFTFSCGRLYTDLVPFGPAYHNVVAEIDLTETGARATVSGGDFREAVGPLGSPFPFDAAMHVACAWGQRYRNVVAFPVGFDRREILLPTSAGETYLCRVFCLPEKGAVLRFNVWLFDEDHRPVEIVQGLKMRDISGGRLKPPVWVRKGV